MKTYINYHSLVPDTGVIKKNAAKDTQNRRGLTVICNRKIKYFLQKYGNIKYSKCLSKRMFIFYS